MKKIKKKKRQINGKIKVMTIGDHPMLPSGVGTQSRYVFESLLESGDFKIVSLGGAVEHHDYRPQSIQPYGEDFRVYPVDGYGEPNVVRSIIRSEKPDILWFMTDPRFYGWLWEIENEVRANIPMVYYHVWDNYPVPDFNKPWYDSNDVVVSISKLTDDIVKKVSRDNLRKEYIPHAVSPQFFRKHDEEVVAEFRKEVFPMIDEDDFIFFWNNRNARRKQSGSLIYWFKDLLDEMDTDSKKLKLVMHTDPKDPNGQDLTAIISHLGLNNSVFLSREKIPPENLALLYNAVDCTVNISDAEGFGLATLESLSCGTPIIVNLTGGLQDQIGTPDKPCGIGIEPASKAVIGSQEVPWIYEDRLNKDDVVAAMKKMYENPELREEFSKNGLEHVKKNFNFEDFKKKWVKLMREVYDQNGSWPNENYTRWTFTEIA